MADKERDWWARGLALCSLLISAVLGLYSLYLQDEATIQRFPDSGTAVIQYKVDSNEELDSFVSFLGENEGRKVELHVALKNVRSLESNPFTFHGENPFSSLVTPLEKGLASHSFPLFVGDAKRLPPRVCEKHPQDCADGLKELKRGVYVLVKNKRMLLGYVFLVRRNSLLGDHLSFTGGHLQLRGLFFDVGNVGISGFLVEPYALTPLNP